MEIISVLDESADLDLLLEACKFVDLAIGTQVPCQLFSCSRLIVLQPFCHRNSNSTSGCSWPTGWPLLLERILCLQVQKRYILMRYSNAERLHSPDICLKAAGDDLNRDDADATNRFSSFQPHIRVLGQRLRSSERSSVDENAVQVGRHSRMASGPDPSTGISPACDGGSLARPILTLRRVKSLRQLRQFHYQVVPINGSRQAWSLMHEYVADQRACIAHQPKPSPG